MNIHAAESLFDEQKYLDAYNLCIELLRDNSLDEDERINILLLMEKSAISASAKVLSDTIPSLPWQDCQPDLDELHIPDILTPPLDMLITLLGTVDDIGRVFELNAQIKGHLNLEKRNSLLRLTKTIDLSTSVRRAALSCCFVTIESTIDFYFTDSFEFNDILKKAFPHLQTAEDLRDYKDNEGLLPPTYSYTDDEKAADVCRIVDEYFPKIVNYHNSNYLTSNKEQFVSVTDTLLTALDGCKLLLSGIDTKSPSIKLKALELSAQIITFELTSCLKTGGNSIMSILTTPDLRRDAIKELAEIHEKISQIDPSFVAPALPSETPTNQPINSGGGCYVATAVYGSYDCPEVWTLRRYRDYTLAKTWYGRVFIKAYYAISPSIVKWFGHTEWFKKMWQSRLNLMVTKLKERGVKSTPYEDKEW